MAPKKVKLRVIADGVQVDGTWHHNGDVFSTSEATAKKLLAEGTVARA